MAATLFTRGSSRKNIVPLRNRGIDRPGFQKLCAGKEHPNRGRKCDRPGLSPPGLPQQILRRKNSSAAPAALRLFLGRLFLRGLLLGSRLGLLFRFLGLFRRFLGGPLFLGRFCRGRRGSGGHAGTLGDDQFLFGLFFDYFFRVAAEFLFLKMHELVLVALIFFFVGHPRSPFDSSAFRGIRRLKKPSRAYKRNAAYLSRVSRPRARDSGECGGRAATRGAADGLGTSRKGKQEWG